MNAELAQFEWPAGLQHELGNSRIVQGRAVGFRLGDTSMVLLAPDERALAAALESLHLRADLAKCPSASLQITKPGRG